MRQLGGIDASFLYMETRETPMHVGGLNLFELPRDYQRDFYDDFKSHSGSPHAVAPCPTCASSSTTSPKRCRS